MWKTAISQPRRRLPVAASLKNDGISRFRYQAFRDAKSRPAHLTVTAESFHASRIQ
jgi:hypothetical protein